MDEPHEVREAIQQASYAFSILDYELDVLRAHHEGYPSFPKRAASILQDASIDAIEQATVLLQQLSHYVDALAPAVGRTAPTASQIMIDITHPALALVAGLAAPLEKALGYKSFPERRREIADQQLMRLHAADRAIWPSELVGHIPRPHPAYWIYLPRFRP